MRIDGERRAQREQQRVAVRLRLGYEVSRNIAARAGPRFDHHRLLQVRRQFLRNRTATMSSGPPAAEDTNDPDGNVSVNSARPAISREDERQASRDQSRRAGGVRHIAVSFASRLQIHAPDLSRGKPNGK